jgi:hypothetical protein
LIVWHAVPVVKVAPPQLRTFLARAARVARPSTLRSLEREWRWRGNGHGPCALPPTWEPNPALLAAATVVWPERYRWPPQASWVEPIRLGMEPLVRVRRSQLTARVPGVVPFVVEVGNRQLAVAIDYGDATALAPGLLTQYDLVFKMQFVNAGYGSERVVPGGFVPNGRSLYRCLPHVRALHDRNRPKVDAYGRFGDDKEIAIRVDAVRRLKEQRVFRYRGGFGRVRYAESLAQAASARVCIDLPGLGPFCFRLVDYLAIGATIVSAPHVCRLHVPLEEGKHFVSCDSNLSNLVAVVDELTRDPARAARMSRAARAYFDRYLDYRQLARYYLATCLDRL